MLLALEIVVLSALLCNRISCSELVSLMPPVMGPMNRSTTSSNSLTAPFNPREALGRRTELELAAAPPVTDLIRKSTAKQYRDCCAT